MQNNDTDNEENKDKNEKKKTKEIEEKEGFTFDKNIISPIKINVQSLKSFEVFENYKNHELNIETNRTNNKIEFNFDKEIIPPITIKNESSNSFPIYENYKINKDSENKSFNDKIELSPEKNLILSDFNINESYTSPTKFEENKSINNSNSENTQTINNSETNKENLQNVEEEDKIINKNNLGKEIINQNIEDESINKNKDKNDNIINEVISVKQNEEQKEIINENNNHLEKINNQNINENINNINENKDETPKDLDEIINEKENEEKEIIDKKKEKAQDDKNNDGNENQKNSQKKKNKKKINLMFDKDIIPPYKMNNIKSEVSAFTIIEMYKEASNQKLTINSSDLITKNIPLLLKNEPFFDKVFNLFEQNILLSVKKNEPLTKINFNKVKLNEIEEINNIIEGNKRINIFEKKENSMISERLPMITEEKKEKKLNNFQEIMNHKKSLYEKTFISDEFNIQQLDIEDEYLNFEYFPSDNIIFKNYEKKYIKSFNLNNNEDIKNRINLSIKDDEEGVNNTISEINNRRINKFKCTKILEEPEIDNEKVFIDYEAFNSSFINLENIDQIYNASYIRSIKPDICNKKINIDCKTENIFTKIFYDFSPDKSNSIKIKLDFNEKETIEKINSKYNEKYIKNMDLGNFSCENNIDIFDNIDLNNIDMKFIEYKNEKIKEREDYILNSGNASIELLKSTLIKDKYNNPQTSFSHNLSIKLNEINNITDNEEIKNISKDLSNNKITLKCEKKLKNKLNHSLMNKYVLNNKIELSNKSNSRLINSYKNINSFSKETNEDYNSKKERDFYEKRKKNLKKINDEINKKDKKIYINKVKMQQENKYDEEIKKEKKFRIVYSLFFFIIPLIYSYYHKFTES